MFNTYARICINEDDEDEAAAARLIAGGALAPDVPAAVLTSTSASRSRTQQGVQQRRGGSGFRAEATIAASASSPAAPRGGSVGNLIDLGDDSAEPRCKPSNPARQRGRNHGPPSQPAVELVTLSPQDPFFDFPAATSSSAQQQPQQPQQPPVATSDGRQPQHPLDFLLGPEPADPAREASNAAASTSGSGSGRQAAPAAFPSFGSFSDILRGFGAASSSPSAAAAAAANNNNPWAAGPAPSAGSNAWGSFAAAPPPGATPSWGNGGGGGGVATHGSVFTSSLQRNVHSQSTNGIDDLLMAQRAMREAAEGAGGAAAGAGGGGGGGMASSVSVPASGGSGIQHKPPGLQRADRAAGADRGPSAVFDPFDPFGNANPPAPSSASFTAGSSSSSTAAARPAPRSGAASSSSDGGGVVAPGGGAVRDASFVAGSGGGEGFDRNQRELLLYAVPLFKDRLVFLPVVNWKDDEDTSTVLGKVSAGVSNVQQGLSNMWHSLKDKGDFSAKMYKAGQAILENMNAEERLMKNIPKKANKLVVHHPATIPPDEIQDQLTQLTATFCYKSVGKAAVAGVMLPVAVGLEVLAVPGIGWYTAYQLFKSTSAAAGGSRLNTYLKNEKSEVRINYAPSAKMDLYILKSRLSPDGVLGSEDIEDLCHDIREPALLHPLQELRNRHLKKTQTTKADYALLPMSAPDVDEQYGSGPKKKD
ncbi:hypothetical protein PLESTF_001221000 [Pleodorina starrii]|nr:hypothetical protein PLESTM_000303600 [Pleodorina starrii]GLC72225.1 hypothetical protein PLESTF_001221000 [Pleodorina starrii]